MKAGRPAYHIRAKWITLTYPQGSRVYYELDSKGNLVNKKQDNSQRQILNTNNTITQKTPPQKDDTKIDSLHLDTEKAETSSITENINDAALAQDTEDYLQGANWIFPNDDSAPDFFENNDMFNNDDSFSWNF